MDKRLRRSGSKGSKGGGSGSAASFIKKGRGWRRRLCRRVVKGTVLKIDWPFRARGFLGLTALHAEGCGGASHQRGIAFSRPQGGCMVFAAKGGIKNGAEDAVPPQWARSANQ